MKIRGVDEGISVRKVVVVGKVNRNSLLYPFTNVYHKINAKIRTAVLRKESRNISKI